MLECQKGLPFAYSTGPFFLTMVLLKILFCSQLQKKIHTASFENIVVSVSSPHVFLNPLSHRRDFRTSPCYHYYRCLQHQLSNNAILFNTEHSYYMLRVSIPQQLISTKTGTKIMRNICIAPNTTLHMLWLKLYY